MATINEERNYRELKVSIRMMNSQRSDTEKNNLIKQTMMKLLKAIKLSMTVKSL